ncbi:MAG: 3-dehydroquinate synthase [Candidatus Roizmanbacteria bacterium]
MKTPNIITVSIPSQTIKYNIYIGSGILQQISQLFDLSQYSKIVIITDTKIYDAIHMYFPQHDVLIQIPQGEEAKNINTVQFIWKELLKNNIDRKSLILNIGGGVIGDIGGFSASTYYRGVAFVQVPTTLLAQVDASVGGKLGFNFGEIKNCIGTFAQPKAVFIDIDTLKTLPVREFHSGFAEIIKHGLIADSSYFELVTSKKPHEFTSTELQTIILQSCNIKKRIVESDVEETGPRKILNFGHTVGHAIESISHSTSHPLLHGEAVNIGMVAEAKISELIGLISHETFLTIESRISMLELPIRYTSHNQELLIKKMIGDKKNSHGHIKWTLINSIGQADFNIEIDIKFVREALSYITD